MRQSRWLVACALTLPVLLIGGEAAAQDDLELERDTVQQRQAAGDAQIDVTRASDAEVSDALTVLGEHVSRQRYDSEDAERVALAARARMEQARAQRAAAQAAVDAAETQLAEAAIVSYMSPPADAQLSQLFGSGPTEAAVQGVLTRTAVSSIGDAVEALRAARTRLVTAETRAIAAEAAARESNDAAQRRLADLNVAYDQQAVVVAEVATRLDALLSESAGLAAQDAQLAAQLDERQAALAAQAADLQRSAEAAREEASSARGGWESPPPSPAVAATRLGNNVPLATVRGIEVHADIANQLAAMLTAAEASGMALEGGGWRSPDEQIAIRREVCGTSDYAIWEMPSWECSPPAARPGRSMHEQGLAVDFTASGDLIRSRSHPAFQWLAANAAQFGFFNLPSEPWHWSTTGS